MWLFGSYAAGTMIGLWMGFKGQTEIIEKTINYLVEHNFIRMDDKGNMLRYDDKN
jgi:hypothetical protein